MEARQMATAVVSPLNPSVKGLPARAVWRLAYRQARAMIRDRATTTAATSWGWYLEHARKRFGASGWTVAQAAGRVVFDARTPVYARTGTEQELARQGLIRRGKPCGCCGETLT